MARFLKEWIAPTMVTRLRKHLETQRGNDLGLENNVLKISMSQGRHVQLIHLDNDGCNQVSDMDTYIQTEFETSGIEAFQQNGRRFSELEGAVITIFTWDIILDLGADMPACPRLFVKSFRLKGAEGSPTFGKPLDISRNPGVQKVSRDLAGMFSKENADESSQLSWSPSPIRSQAGNPTDHASLSPNLQPGQRERSTDFATQVIDAPKRPARQTKAARVPNQDILLGILKHEPGTASKTEVRKAMAQKPKSNASKSTISLILQPISEDRAKAMTTTLEAKANKQQSQSITHSSMPDTAQHKADKPYAPESESPGDNDSEKENSQEVLSGPGRQPAKPANPEIVSNSERANTQQPVPLDDLFQSSNPFEGLKRVPRKFVRIPAAQKALLESNNAWFEPVLDGRPRYARLLPQVTEDLDEFYKRRPNLVAEESSEDERDDVSEDEEDVDSPGRNTSLDEPSEVKLEEMNSEEELSQDESDLLLSSPVRWSNEREVLREQITGATKHVPQPQPRITLDLSARCSTSKQIELAQHVTEVSSTDYGENDLPSAQYMRQGNSASRSPTARPRTRIPLMRSSSPFDEEELDLAVPHAMGDIVGEDEEHDGKLDASQELPCTASFKGTQIQVEQTPLVGIRGFRNLLVSGTTKVAMVANNATSSTIPSSAVFPATLENQNIDAFTLSSAVKDNHTEENISEESRLPSDGVDMNMPSSSELTNLSPTVARQPPPSTPMISSSDPEKASNSPVVQVPATGQKTKQTFPGLRSPPRALKSVAEIANPAEISSKRPKSDLGGMDPREMKRANRARFLESERIRAKDASFDVVVPKSPVPLTLERTNHVIDRPVDTTVRVSSTYTEDPLASASSHQKGVPASTETNTADLNASQGAGTLCPASRKEELRTFVEKDVVMTEESTDQGEYVASQDVWDLRSTSPEEITDLKDSVVQLQRSQQSWDKSRSTNVASRHTIHNEGESGVPQDISLLRSLYREEDADLKDDTVQPQPSQQTSNKSRTTSPVSEHKIYDEFVATYSDYAGSEFDFIKALVYLEWLQKEHGTKLAYCDDFIRVINAEHRKHVRESLSSGAKPLTGIDFYTEKTRIPSYRAVYRYNVISPQNIQEALSTLNSDKVEDIREKYWGQQSSIKKSSFSPLDASHHMDNNEQDTGIFEDRALSSSRVKSINQEGNKRMSSPIQRHLAKKRFFETASQPANTRLEKTQTPKHVSKSFNGTSNVKTSRSFDGRERTTPKRTLSNSGSGTSSKKRKLPWPADKAASEGSGARPQERRILPRETATARVFTSSPPIASRLQTRATNRPLASTPARRDLNYMSNYMSEARNDREETRCSENPPSPILGSLRSPEPQLPSLKRSFNKSSLSEMEIDDPFTTSPPNRRSTLPAQTRISIPHSLKRKQPSDPTLTFTDPTDPFTEPSKSSRRSILPAKSSTSLVKAEEWLRTTPLKKMSPFEAKVDRMRLSGWKPKSQRIQRITGRSYCTMKKSELSEEPKTQAWSF